MVVVLINFMHFSVSPVTADFSKVDAPQAVMSAVLPYLFLNSSNYDTDSDNGSNNDNVNVNMTGNNENSKFSRI